MKGYTYAQDSEDNHINCDVKSNERPSPEEWPELPSEIRLRETISRLTPVEAKIFATLIKSKKSLTTYDMVKSGVASNRTVLERLHSMREKGWLVAHEEKNGRRRIFYKLKDNEWTFFLALAVKENWQDPKTIDKIAEIHRAKLPLIFGKLRYFKQTGIKGRILDMLSLAIGVLLIENPYFTLPNDALSIPILIPPSLNGFGPRLIEAINNYPDDSMKKPETLADVVTADTFCLTILKETSKMHPGMYNFILNLKGDQEISEWINNYFLKKAARNQLESDKIEWCLNLWNSIPST